MVERGYALAVAYCGDIAIDRYDAPLYKEGYRAVSLWAWGMSRIADYLLSDSRFDPKRLAVIGHSRLGKAALLAGARDERFALVCPHQSGTGGAAPSRGNVGESVQRINTVFPHWFSDRFKAYNADPERLPFDQNALVALVAPRSVLLTNAVDDQWANPDGQFEVLRGADPTYRLVCGEGYLTATRPPVNSLSKGRLGYWIRPGDHRMNAEDWGAFLDYADACFHKKR
jgi:hypothetical protein